MYNTIGYSLAEKKLLFDSYHKTVFVLDIDECEIRDGPHAHKCVVEKACQNYVGGYRCRCSIVGDGLKQISESKCEGNKLCLFYHQIAVELCICGSVAKKKRILFFVKLMLSIIVYMVVIKITDYLIYFFQDNLNRKLVWKILNTRAISTQNHSAHQVFFSV